MAAHRIGADGAVGLVLIVTTLISAETALGFTFDPRYKDFPFAALTMGGGAVRGFDAGQPAVGGRAPDCRIRLCRRAGGGRGLYVVSTRVPRNWQSMWTCAVYLGLALTLWRARAVQIPK